MSTQLGKSEKLGLSGRPKKRVGILSTSKVYEVNNEIVIFYPEFSSVENFWIVSDPQMLTDRIKTELYYLQSHWRLPGRPLVVIPIYSESLLNQDGAVHQPLVAMMQRFDSGYSHGVRINLGRVEDFLSTSFISKATFQNLEMSNTNNTRRSSDSTPSVSTNQLPDIGLRRTSLKKTDQKVRYLPSVNRKHGLHSKCKRIIFCDQLNLTDNRLIDQPAKRLSRNSVSEKWPSGGAPDSGPGAKQQRSLQTEKLLNGSTLTEQATILCEIFMDSHEEYRINLPSHGAVKITTLMQEVFEQAMIEQDWLLVRQLGGFLNKQLTGLDQAVTDILIRQKSITVGSDENETIIDRPLKAEEIQSILSKSCDDIILDIFHQEIIFYLGMLIRSTPSLFDDFLRLRVGLIAQVLASEISRLFDYPGVEATAALLSLPPSEIKTLLSSLISGQEIAIKSPDKQIRSRSNTGGDGRSRRKSFMDTDSDSETLKGLSRTLSMAKSKTMSDVISSQTLLLTVNGSQSHEFVFEAPGERAGTWFRRRQLDGALNRVPADFYAQVWKVLDRCHGIEFGGRVIPSTVTREMTPYELKFALLVENTLNCLPEPGMRQMIVEALSILSLLASIESIKQIGWIIDLDRLEFVFVGHEISFFLES